MEELKKCVHDLLNAKSNHLPLLQHVNELLLRLLPLVRRVFDFDSQRSGNLLCESEGDTTFCGYQYAMYG